LRVVFANQDGGLRTKCLPTTAIAPMVQCMITQDFDVIVIGAGMAGSTAAAHLAPHKRVALVEAEEAPGYHTTGRSAATWILNYGPPDVRVLNGLSKPFLDNPPPGFAEHPLTRPRPVLTLAPEDQRDDLARMIETGIDMRPIAVDAVRAMVPALRQDYLAAAAIEDAADLDVAAIQQGFLRQLRAAGGVLALRARAGRIERTAGQWAVETSSGTTFRAPVVVNASGAWGDEVATIAGVHPIGLIPCRRTGAIIDPAPFMPEDWPMLMDAAGTWYARPEARTKLMVSPADETPMEAHDVQPDELDIAIGIDRMQQGLDIEVRRVERAWAGLRTFTPDHSLAFGWDARETGFFWCVGQGGYGIQTSPAAGQLVADLVLGRDPGAAGAIVEAIDPRRFATT
jgi:D-arginine dehydrogenase